MALIILLRRAGLCLDLSDPKKVGCPPFLVSCMPAACETLVFVLFAPRLLGVTRLEAAIMGAIGMDMTYRRWLVRTGDAPSHMLNVRM